MTDVMRSLLHDVEAVFGAAISAAYPALPGATLMVTASTNPKFGDYQCNSAMAIAGVSKLYALLR